MEYFLHFILAISLLILAAKAGGYLSYRLGQPSVLGELLVGILLGPTVINFLQLPYLKDPDLNEIIHILAEIGVMLLMFIAGLELHMTDLVKSGKVAGLAGVLGVVLPLILGAGVGLIFKLEPVSAIFLGLILSATSVSISAQTLMELKVLRTPVGTALMGAAVFDDILVILTLSVFSVLTRSGENSGLGEIGIILLQMALFLVFAGLFGWFLLPWFSRKVNRLQISNGLIAFVFVVILLYGWLAEELGHMAPITGAFLAGLFLSRSPLKERIESGILVLGYAVFVPIFFIDVGLSANVRLLIGNAFWLFLILVFIAVIGKVVGSGFGALMGGMPRLDALRLGVGMVSRGEVGLIVASVGLSSGLIDETIFAAVVGVILATTLLTPPMLRSLYSSRPSKKSQPSGQPESAV